MQSASDNLSVYQGQKVISETGRLANYGVLVSRRRQRPVSYPPIGTYQTVGFYSGINSWNNCIIFEIDLIRLIGNTDPGHRV
jgi:hypothetical protein